MIHFAGGAVTGFIVPQAESPVQALKLLKEAQIKRINEFRRRSPGDPYGTIGREKLFMQSLKRPWRFAGEWRTVRGTNKLIRTGFKWGRKSPVVAIQEMIEPITSNYWLEDTATGTNLCNQHSAVRFSFATEQ